jgi:hypothetical protein
MPRQRIASMTCSSVPQARLAGPQGPVRRQASAGASRREKPIRRPKMHQRSWSTNGKACTAAANQTFAVTQFSPAHQHQRVQRARRKTVSVHKSAERGTCSAGARRTASQSTQSEKSSAASSVVARAPWAAAGKLLDSVIHALLDSASDTFCVRKAWGNSTAKDPRGHPEHQNVRTQLAPSEMGALQQSADSDNVAHSGDKRQRPLTPTTLSRTEPPHRRAPMRRSPSAPLHPAKAQKPPVMQLRLLSGSLLKVHFMSRANTNARSALVALSALFDDNDGSKYSFTCSPLPTPFDILPARPHCSKQQKHTSHQRGVLKNALFPITPSPF